MKALKIIGVVVGIHAFALLVIFANPGCSSTKAAAQSDGSDAGSVVPAPAPAAPDASSSAGGASPGVAPAPGSADASAPAAASAGTGITFTPVEPPAEPAPAPAVLYSPTRPGTPAASVLEEQPVADVTPAVTYTVVKGDTLSMIAKRNHTTRAAIAAANHLRSGSTLHIGQKLLISAGGSGGKAKGEKAPSSGAAASAGDEGGPAAEAGSAAPAASSSHAGQESTRYTVKPGESLGVIARRFGVRVGDIAKANSISDPKKIRPGQELIIPAKSASHAHASASSKASAPAPRPVQAAPADMDGSAGAVGPAPQSAPTVVPAPSATDSEGRPAVTLPAAGQDLDSGLKPSSTASEDVPVVKVEDGTKP